MEKKEWSEPELIVLVRSKPEEAVLSVCKGTRGVSSAFTEFDACIGQVNLEAPTACISCSVLADS